MSENEGKHVGRLTEMQREDAVLVVTAQDYLYG